MREGGKGGCRGQLRAFGRMLIHSTPPGPTKRWCTMWRAVCTVRRMVDVHSRAGCGTPFGHLHHGGPGCLSPWVGAELLVWHSGSRMAYAMLSLTQVPSAVAYCSPASVSPESPPTYSMQGEAGQHGR